MPKIAFFHHRTQIENESTRKSTIETTCRGNVVPAKRWAKSIMIIWQHDKQHGLSDIDAGLDASRFCRCIRFDYSTLIVDTVLTLYTTKSVNDFFDPVPFIRRSMVFCLPPFQCRFSLDCSLPPDKYSASGLSQLDSAKKTSSKIPSAPKTAAPPTRERSRNHRNETLSPDADHHDTDSVGRHTVCSSFPYIHDPLSISISP